MKKSKILIPLALLLLCLLLPLALAGCGGKVSAEQNAVTSVTLDEKGIITVKAALIPRSGSTCSRSPPATAPTRIWRSWIPWPRSSPRRAFR